MTTPFTRLGAAIVLIVAASLATACAPTPPAADPDVSQSPASTPSAPAPEPTGEATDDPAASGDPTCDTIISEAIVADFESIGWTSRADPFYIGETELPDGLLCVWADFEGPAGDHLQLFGWSPIESDVATESQDALVSQGWVRESAVEGIYITESPETSIATDEDGYGMTYLFGDGWVKLADTKQGLLLIEWPRD